MIIIFKTAWGLIPHTNRPKYARLNFKKKVHITHTKEIHPAQVIKETVPLGPTGHLLFKASLPILGVIADLLTTYKQTQNCSQNGSTKKPTPKERTGETYRKKI